MPNRITEMMSDLKDRTLSEEAFVTKVLEIGYPVIEPVDNNYSNVTLIYRGDERTENVVVLGNAHGHDYKRNQMERIDGTSIWYTTNVFLNETEVIYDFFVNDALDDDYQKRFKNRSFDPLNSFFFELKDKNPEDDYKINYIAMPDVKPKKWTGVNRVYNAPKGNVETMEFTSSILANSRDIVIYTPFNMPPDSTECNVLLLNDGSNYVDYYKTCEVLDEMIHLDLIDPTIAIFIDSSESRYSEYTFNDDFVEFINQEVESLVSSKVRLTDDPKKRVIGGLSLGGLTATYIGLNHPEKFGKVLCQSGSLFFKGKDEEHNWIIDQYRQKECLDLDFYITYGILEGSENNEPNIIDSNLAFIEVLNEKGYKYEVNVFGSGHDNINWGETCAEGILHLLAKK